MISTSASAEVVEVVVFKSKTGISEQKILSAASGMRDTLESWSGFISRELISLGEGAWIDVVHWRDNDAAQAALQYSMEQESCLLFFSLIEEKGQQMYHGKRVLTQ